MNTHEYEKIKIHDNSWVIHDNSCRKKIIYYYSCIFMLIRVEKKSLCSFLFILPSFRRICRSTYGRLPEQEFGCCELQWSVRKRE